MREIILPIMRSVRLYLLLVPLIALFITQSAFAKNELQLAFGIYTTDKPTVMVEIFRPILSAIETDLAVKLNRPVAIRLQIAPTYELGVAAIVNGEVDFSQLGPASYIAAYKRNPKLQILALESKNGKLTSKGIISVHKDSAYTDVTDLKQTRFAFGNESSTIGRYLSQSYLSRHGVSAKELAHYDYLGRHDLVGYAVAQKTFDAGALKEGTFNKLVKKGLPIRALAQFENVNKPWIARSDMDRQLFDSLRTVLLELSAPEAFAALGKKQFVLGDDSDFAEIRYAIDRNSDFFSVPGKTISADIDHP